MFNFLSYFQFFTDVSPDISLYLNSELISSINMVTDRNLATPALQGQYWCEVWDRQTLTRKRSKPFIVRFSGKVQVNVLSGFSRVVSLCNYRIGSRLTF